MRHSSQTPREPRRTVAALIRAALPALGAALLAAPAAAQAQPATRAAPVRTEGHAATMAQTPGMDMLTAARAMPRRQAAHTGTLDYPYGICVDNAGNVYVTNLFAGVNIYSAANKFRLSASISSGLSYPAAVAVSFNGNIYVANNGTDNVSVFSPGLTQLGTISDGTLSNPVSMFIDSDDTTWVLDAAGMLHAYLADGATLPSTHTGGNVVGPWGPNVTVWGIANPNGGYDETFENIAQAVSSGPNLSNDFVDGSPYAAGEAQDQFAQEYVSDAANNLVQIWDRTGTYEIGSISTPATPYGVAVDANRGRLYVALTTVNEVYVYSTKAPYKLISVIH